MKIQELLKILGPTDIILERTDSNKNMFDYIIFNKSVNSDYLPITGNNLNIVACSDFSKQKYVPRNFAEISLEEFKLALL